MTPDQKNLLAQALRLDVRFQKIVAQITKYIHKNPEPDFNWIDENIFEASAIEREWDAIHQEVEVAAYFDSPEVKDYYLVTVGFALEVLQRIPGKVRARIEGGELPEYKDERVFPMFEYSPEVFMNEATHKLAQMVGASLV
jgi:hydrogenase maturation factor